MFPLGIHILHICPYITYFGHLGHVNFCLILLVYYNLKITLKLCIFHDIHELWKNQPSCRSEFINTGTKNTRTLGWRVWITAITFSLGVSDTHRTLELELEHKVNAGSHERLAPLSSDTLLLIMCYADFNTSFRHTEVSGTLFLSQLNILLEAMSPIKVRERRASVLRYQNFQGNYLKIRRWSCMHVCKCSCIQYEFQRSPHLCLSGAEI